MAKSGLGWFKFDEASGNITDSKGTAVGTVTGATRVTGWNGQGSALNFNSGNVVTFNQKVAVGGARSFRFKMKSTLVSTTFSAIINTAVGINNSNNANGDLIGMENGKFAWLNYKGTNTTQHFKIYSDIFVADGQWHDILCTWDGTTSTNGVKIYVDDMNTPSLTVTSDGNSISSPNINMSLGKSYDTVFQYTYVGQLDELEIYNNVIDTTSNKSFILLSDGYKKFIQGSPVITITENFIPIMTSNTSPSGIASASEEPSGLEAWKAFNGIYSGNSTESWATLSKSGWLAYEFPVKKIITSYRMRIRSDIYAMGSVNWTFEGLNDNGIWDILDTQTGVNWNNGGQYKNFTLNNTKAYKKYRLNSTLNGANGYTSISVLEMFGETILTPATPTTWKTVSPTLPTLPQFQTEGMDDLSIFDRKVQTVLESPKSMTSEVLGAGKVYKTSVDLKKYFDLRKIEVK